MISEREGYEAMLHMLNIFWKFSGSKDLTDILSQGQYANDGEPVNPDILFMWEDAVEKVKNGEPPLTLNLKK